MIGLIGAKDINYTRFCTFLKSALESYSLVMIFFFSVSSVPSSCKCHARCDAPGQQLVATRVLCKMLTFVVGFTAFSGLVAELRVPMPV